MLRLAPALHTVRVLDRWPPVNLLRYTKAVTVFEMEYSGWNYDGFSSAKLDRMLRHYEGHLQVSAKVGRPAVGVIPYIP